MGRRKGSKNKEKEPTSNNGNGANKELDLSYTPILSMDDFQSWLQAQDIITTLGGSDVIDDYEDFVSLCANLQRLSGLIEGTYSAVRASWERQEFTQRVIEESVLEQQNGG